MSNLYKAYSIQSKPLIMESIFNIILAATILISAPLIGAEIIPVWNKENEIGTIEDMELLKGGDKFLLVVRGNDASEIQIRNVSDGELVRAIPTEVFPSSKLVITPDSSRFIHLSGTRCDVRSVDDDLPIIKSINLEVIYTNIALDPIRPYIYVTGIELKAYNYETGEFVADFEDYIADIDTKIDISNDGKYLATLNDGKAYLNVWDLNTREQIRSVQLWDDRIQNVSDYWCDSEDIKFSEINSDVIFYSGRYPWSEVPDTVPSPTNGLRKYIISTNNNSHNITPGSPNSRLSGKIILFDNENRSVVYKSGNLFFYEFQNKVHKFYYKSPGIYIGGKAIYNKQDDYFIGYENSYFCQFLYERETSIKNEYKGEIIISPNPTNSFVNVKSDCDAARINYQISDINGVELMNAEIENQLDGIQVDFSTYPTGIYFLTFDCDNHPKTIKVVRE